MPAERVSMRKIRDVLRLTQAMGMSRRLVGEATGIGKTAVRNHRNPRSNSPLVEARLHHPSQLAGSSKLLARVRRQCGPLRDKVPNDSLAKCSGSKAWLHFGMSA